jgi:hypothetical protein
VERQIAELRASLEAEEGEVALLLKHEDARETSYGSDRRAMAEKRGAAE